MSQPAAGRVRAYSEGFTTEAIPERLRWVEPQGDWTGPGLSRRPKVREADQSAAPQVPTVDAKVALKVETAEGAFRMREDEPTPRLGAGLHRTP